ncbi:MULTISPECIES: GTPase Era [unclassified Luteococcus]|uniref:GTPase Era n=1 Tax=unclassified Luteococcus TaxID=2639923 RepID=UPI00313DA192
MPTLDELMSDDFDPETDIDWTGDKTFRSGFACFVGRPNAGKSTLTNALVGSKIAITSSKPQTTRHSIRGIVDRPDAQLVLIDTPGLHKPRTLLGQRLNDLVRETWTEVDVIGVCLPSNQPIGPGDTFLVTEIAKLPKKPQLVALATKTDLVSGDRLRQHLLDIQALEDKLGIRWEQIIPCSAVSGEQTDVVADELVKLLPYGPAFYPDGEVTDEPTETLVKELIREAALEGVRDELPHSITVEIDEMGLREGRPEDRPLLDVFASMIVERDSQKGIMIGHKGEHLKEVGTRARQQISALLGTPVHLDLKVKVLKDWQRDPKYLNRLGF